MSSKKIIFVGGATESKLALDYVARRINHLDSSYEVSTYTFGFALAHRHEINKAAEGNLLITHSSGAMVIERGARPSRAVFISPSQPAARHKVLVRATLKTLSHFAEALVSSQRSKYIRLLLSGATELFFHPIRNLGPFINGSISRFDLRTALPNHDHLRPEQTKIIISKRDEMFSREENVLDDLKEQGVAVVEIDAKHDDLFIDTKNIIKEALKV